MRAALGGNQPRRVVEIYVAKINELHQEVVGRTASPLLPVPPCLGQAAHQLTLDCTDTCCADDPGCVNDARAFQANNNTGCMAVIAVKIRLCAGRGKQSGL